MKEFGQLRLKQLGTIVLVEEWRGQRTDERRHESPRSTREKVKWEEENEGSRETGGIAKRWN